MIQWIRQMLCRHDGWEEVFETWYEGTVLCRKTLYWVCTKCGKEHGDGDFRNRASQAGAWRNRD